MPTIENFQGPYEFLSNFYPCKINYDGFNFASVEHAFQAAKFRDYSKKFAISKASSPGQAKRMGKDFGGLRTDWGEACLVVMYDLLKQKFNDPKLKKLLLATVDAELQEGNRWGDAFWGMVGGQGLNNLGKLLMRVREELVTTREGGP